MKKKPVLPSSPVPPGSIDEYIAEFPADVQAILKKIRQTIHKAAPDAEEKISYRIPSFTLHGALIYFAAFKNHIGLYPAPRGAEKFKKELAAYEGGKGTVRFPLDQPIPYGLITRIVKFRVKDNLARKRAKASTQKSVNHRGTEAQRRKGVGRRNTNKH